MTGTPGIHRPRLARGTVHNLLGMGAPLLAGLLSIPVLVRGLGVERFGVLTLAWVITGYFSLFDLGLGRALTQLIATRVTERGTSVAPRVVWPALGLMLLLGLVGGLALAAVAPWLVTDVLRLSPALVAETRGSLFVLATSIPVVVVSAGYQGILSAFHEFGVLNAIRGPMGVLTFVGPALIMPFAPDLVSVTMVLVAVRLAACIAMAIACRRFVPPMRGAAPDGDDDRPGALFAFGAWMTVTNLVAPMMAYLDRFVVGSMLGASAVAYYATPYEVVTKALVIPAAIVGVLFPAFAASAASDRARLARLFVRGTKYIVLLLFPPMLLAVAFAPEGLRLWLGAEFATNSAPVLQWLAIGVFLNCVSQLFLALVLGVGRPDVAAKLQLVEVGPYLLLLWWAIREFGIVGAAIAWTVRVTVDTALLFALSRRFTGLAPREHRHVGAGVVLATIGLCVPLLMDGVAMRLLLVSALGAAFVALGWRSVLAPDERGRLRAVVTRA